MTGIKCKNNHVFCMIVDDCIDAEWKLLEAYYKVQGCSVAKSDSLRFSKEEACEHCSKLEHEFENLIDSIVESKS